MAKTILSPDAMSYLRQALHVATLEALLSSRRWRPGEIVFQGGTSLHLAHGSPRFSEDLDFLVHSSLDLTAIGASVQARLAHTSWLPRGTKVTVTKAKDGRNPHAFVVAIGGSNVIGSVKVKVELWQTTEASMAPLQVRVEPVRLTNGPAAGAQAFVPTADLHEIFVDKVFAVGARTYLKPRDLFDLDWLLNRHPEFVVDASQMRLRLATYPNESPAQWLEKARARSLTLPAQAAEVASDLKRWLPTSWPMDESTARVAISSSVRALEQGVAVMETIDEAPASPEPNATDERSSKGRR